MVRNARQKKSVPELRFPKFTSEWHDKKLGDLIVERKEYPDKALPLYSLTIENGIVPKSERYERSHLVKSSVDAYKVMHRDDFAFNPMNLRFGAIARYSDDWLVTVSKYYNIFYCKDDTDSRFMEAYLSRKSMVNYYDRMSIGTLEEKKRVHFSDFCEFIKPFPEYEEQQEISSFLGSVDAWLDNLRKQKTALETYKRGMMQKLFTQQVRFKGDGEWMEKQLCDLLDYKQPTQFIVNSTEYSDEYKTPVLTAGKSFILGYTNETEGIFNYELPVIIFDDFTTATQFVDFPFKVKSSAMKILVPLDNNNIKFLYEAMQHIKFEVGGHGRHWISKYSKLTIMVPSPEVQQKIAEFAQSLDDLIAAKTEEISKVEQWKRGLMQKMFV